MDLKKIFGFSAKKYLLSEDGSISFTVLFTILFVVCKSILQINEMDLDVVKVPAVIMDIAKIGQYLTGGGGIIALIARFKKDDK